MKLRMLRRAITLSAVVLFAMLVPSFALGHAVVFPKESPPGAYEKYVLRVPNERDVPTTKVEIRFPPQIRVVSFTDVAGWTLKVVRDSAQHVTGAVWTGVLPRERFVEFPFVAVNPKQSATLTWPTFQTYAGGERVEWTGEANSRTPASVTRIDSPSTATSLPVAPLYLSAGAIVLSLISLGLAMRQPQGGPKAVR